MPEIKRNMPFAEYHAVKALSASFLKDAFRHSPAHAAIDKKDISIIGEATHCKVLESKDFCERFAIMPEGDGRTSAVKKARAEALQQYPNHKWLTPAEAESVCNMALAIDKHPIASKLLMGCEDKELSVFWENGAVNCKARFDAVNQPEGVIIDLKTTVDASCSAFERTIRNYAYHIQAAWYLMGAEECGLSAHRFVFIAVETSAPYGVTVHELDVGYIEAAIKQLYPFIDEYAEAQKTGTFNSYKQIINYISCPSWMEDGL